MPEPKKTYTVIIWPGAERVEAEVELTEREAETIAIVCDDLYRALKGSRVAPLLTIDQEAK